MSDLIDEIDDEIYESTPEESARIERAVETWQKWKDAVIPGQEFSHLQESAIINMLFRMQEAEHRHFGIEIPKGRIVKQSGGTALED